MSADRQVDVAVVGAGGGGAVLGLALLRKGIRTVVLEQAQGPPGGVRGEILQPNGQQILDTLGLLDKLPADAANPVRFFHFRKAGGARLCTVDYGTLPGPYNRAIVTLPHLAHRPIVNALQREGRDAVCYGARFKALRWRDGRVVGLDAEVQGTPFRVDAKLVVGADGALSQVRGGLGIPARLHRYREAYLLALFDSPHDVTDAQFYVGRRTILGICPVARRRLYAFYMIPAESMPAVRAAGLEALRARWRAIAPELADAVDSLKSWEQTGYMPTGRVTMPAWVADGAALIGDAAHAMNPHVSQGRMQAMVDAMTLAEVAAGCLERDDFSAVALSAYERARRPQVHMLQRLADEEVFFWNTGNPLLARLRDRVFRTLDGNARLRHQILTATAGLRVSPPLGPLDRVIAAGLLPDLCRHDSGVPS